MLLRSANEIAELETLMRESEAEMMAAGMEVGEVYARARAELRGADGEPMAEELEMIDGQSMLSLEAADVDGAYASDAEDARRQELYLMGYGDAEIDDIDFD